MDGLPWGGSLWRAVTIILETRTMAVQQSKVSKRTVRTRHAANRYKGVQVTLCTNCGAPCLPHRVCKKCGMYDGKTVLMVKQDEK